MVSSSRAANANRKSALIVSETQVNRIVVSRIVESTGMKTLSMTLPQALGLSHQQQFALIVIDGGPGTASAAEVIRRFSTGPQLAEVGKPAIILLSTSMALPEGIETDAIDAVVAKPLTPDRLEAEVLRLTDGVSG